MNLERDQSTPSLYIYPLMFGSIIKRWNGLFSFFAIFLKIIFVTQQKHIHLYVDGHRSVLYKYIKHRIVLKEEKTKQCIYEEKMKVYFHSSAYPHIYKYIHLLLPKAEVTKNTTNTIIYSSPSKNKYLRESKENREINPKRRRAFDALLAVFAFSFLLEKFSYVIFYFMIVFTLYLLSHAL